MNEQKVNGNGQAEPTQIIPAGTVAVSPADFETTDQILKRAQDQITLHQGIVKLIAASISPRHVMLFGENIWLTKDACLRILGWIGADVLPDGVIQEHRYESNDGPYIVFETWGTIKLKNGRQVRAPGNASTIDDFFAKENVYVCEKCGAQGTFEGSGDNRKFRCSAEKAYGRWKKVESYKPLSEIDIPSVRIKATTNFYNHALQVLGVMPTKDELLAAGMNLGEGGKVEFGGKKQETPQKAPAATPKPAPRAAEATHSHANSTGPASAAHPKDSGVSKAQIPPDPLTKKELRVGQGIVSEVIEKTTKPNRNGKGGGNPFLEVIQNGHSLYCFKNSEIETIEGPEQTFNLIAGAKGQFCDFVVETKTPRGGDRPMHGIVGAKRIGRHEWDAITGEPMQASSGYAATDEDIPF